MQRRYSLIWNYPDYESDEDEDPDGDIPPSAPPWIKSSRKSVEEANNAWAESYNINDKEPSAPQKTSTGDSTSKSDGVKFDPKTTKVSGKGKAKVGIIKKASNKKAGIFSNEAKAAKESGEIRPGE